MKTLHRSILALFVGLALTVCTMPVYADALQLDFLLAGFQDVSGDPLTGAIVVTRNSANSAAKAVWEDKDQTLPSALGKSQFNLDSEGRAVVFGEGIYTVILYDSADTGLTSPLYTFSGVTYESLANLADNTVGSGSDLVAHTGTARTVTETLDGYADGTVPLAAPAITSFVNSTHDHADAPGGGTLPESSITIHDHADAVSGGNTLTIPTVADMTNAQHDHTDATNGGTLPATFGLSSVQVFTAAYPTSAPTLAIGTTKTDVANSAFNYVYDGIQYAKGAVAAGTPPGNDIIPQNTYGAVALDIDTAGTISAVEAVDNATGYASAALAIAGIPNTATGLVRMGTVTVIRTDDNFEFATDDLDIAASTVIYTDAQLSGATWTKPDGVTKVLIEVIGGGGTGGTGSSGNSGGSGGGGGGACIELLDVTGDTTASLTIGASAGSSSFVLDTSSGGCSATGGANGDTGGTPPPDGGVHGSGADGDINLDGSDGDSVGAGIGEGSKGGSAAGWFGGGGGQGVYGDPGADGGNYGGGGGGGDDTTDDIGGAGSGGIVVVWEYK